MSWSDSPYITFGITYRHTNSKAHLRGIFLLAHPRCSSLKDTEAMEKLANLILKKQT